MKNLIFSMTLPIFLGLLASTVKASDFTIPDKGEATLVEEMSFLPGPGKKKPKYGGYDKKAAKNRARGSKCGDRRNRKVRRGR